METEKPEIKIFSFSFHVSVFLPLLFQKITSQTCQKAPQINNIPFEYTILTSIAIGFMVMGFINHENLVWLIVGVLSACGFMLMLFSSVLSRRQTGHNPTWQSFRLIPFLFSILAGMSISLIITANISEFGLAMKMAGAAVGLISGYLIGVPAGFWFQSLGWICPIIEIIILVPLTIGFSVLLVLITIA